MIHAGGNDASLDLIDDGKARYWSIVEWVFFFFLFRNQCRSTGCQPCRTILGVPRDAFNCRRHRNVKFPPEVLKFVSRRAFPVCKA